MVIGDNRHTNKFLKVVICTENKSTFWRSYKAGDSIAGANQEHLDTVIYLKAMSQHPAHQCHLHFKIGTTGGKITWLKLPPDQPLNISTLNLEYSH